MSRQLFAEIRYTILLLSEFFKNNVCKFWKLKFLNMLSDRSEKIQYTALPWQSTWKVVEQSAIIFHVSNRSNNTRTFPDLLWPLALCTVTFEWKVNKKIIPAGFKWGNTVWMTPCKLQIQCYITNIMTGYYADQNTHV